LKIGDQQRFKNKQALANYAGLVPTVRESNGKHKGSGHLSRHGNRKLRHVMVEAAWIAAKRVPVYQHCFDRIMTRRGKPIAIIAVARKMMEHVFVMLKKRQPFRYTPVVEPSTQANAALERAGCNPG